MENCRKDVIKHPEPTPFFTGRNKEIQQLIELHNSTQTKKLVVISGMGGIGKTELVKQFLSTLNCNNKNVAWMSASDLEATTEETLVLDNFYTGYPANNNDDNAHQGNNTPSVVVIDGVSIESKLLDCIMKLADQQCMVIITTVLQNLSSVYVTHIKLKEWSEDEVHAYVNLSLRSDEAVEDIRLLNSYFVGYPLAIHQAVCYILDEKSSSIEGESYGIPHFIKEFQVDGVDLLKDKMSFESYRKTMLTTLDTTFLNVRTKYGQVGTLAYGILQVFGLLLNFTTVHHDVLLFLVRTTLYNPQNLSQEDVNTSLELLKSYSLVETDAKVVKVHRLVGMVLRHKMGSTIPLDHDGSNGIDDTFSTVEEQLRYNFILRLDLLQIFKNNFQYVLDIWEGCTSNNKLVRTFYEFPDSLFHKLTEFSLFDMAANLARYHVPLFIRIFEKHHTVTTKMQLNLVFALLQLKNGSIEVLSICRHIFNGNKPNTFHAVLFKDMEITLQLLAENGMLKESANFGKSIFPSVLATNFENGVETFSLGIIITKLLKKCGQYADCINFYTGLLKHFEHNSVDTACVFQVRYKRAVCLYHEKMFKEAEKELINVVSARSLHLGKCHVKTLRAKYWLTLSIVEQEQNHRSKVAILKTLLTECQKALGDHKLPRKIKTCIDDLVLVNDFVIVGENLKCLQN